MFIVLDGSELGLGQDDCSYSGAMSILATRLAKKSNKHFSLLGHSDGLQSHSIIPPLVLHVADSLLGCSAGDKSKARPHGRVFGHN